MVEIGALKTSVPMARGRKAGVDGRQLAKGGWGKTAYNPKERKRGRRG